MSKTELMKTKLPTSELAARLFPNANSSDASTAIVRRVKKFKAANPEDSVELCKIDRKNAIVSNGSILWLTEGVSPMLTAGKFAEFADRAAFDQLMAELTGFADPEQADSIAIEAVPNLWINPTDFYKLKDKVEQITNERDELRGENEALTDLAAQMESQVSRLEAGCREMHDSLSARICEADILVHENKVKAKKIERLELELFKMSDQLDKNKAESDRMKSAKSLKQQYKPWLWVFGTLLTLALCSTYWSVYSVKWSWADAPHILFMIASAVLVETLFAILIYSGRSVVQFGWLKFSVVWLSGALLAAHFLTRPEPTGKGIAFGLLLTVAILASLRQVSLVFND